MTRFVVDLGAVTIPVEKQHAIAAAVQSAVLEHLASIPATYPHVTLLPHPWLGLVLRPTIPELQKAEQDIASFATGGP